MEVLLSRHFGWAGGPKLEPTWAGFWGASLETPPSSCPTAPTRLETLSNPLFLPSRLLQLQAEDRPRQAQAVTWWCSAPLPLGTAAHAAVPWGCPWLFSPPCLYEAM